MPFEKNSLTTRRTQLLALKGKVEHLLARKRANEFIWHTEEEILHILDAISSSDTVLIAITSKELVILEALNTWTKKVYPLPKDTQFHEGRIFRYYSDYMVLSHDGAHCHLSIFSNSLKCFTKSFQMPQKAVGLADAAFLPLCSSLTLLLDRNLCKLDGNFSMSSISSNVDSAVLSTDRTFVVTFSSTREEAIIWREDIEKIVKLPGIQRLLGCSQAKDNYLLLVQDKEGMIQLFCIGIDGHTQSRNLGLIFCQPFLFTESSLFATDTDAIVEICRRSFLPIARWQIHKSRRVDNLIGPILNRSRFLFRSQNTVIVTNRIESQ